MQFRFRGYIIEVLSVPDRTLIKMIRALFFYASLNGRRVINHSDHYSCSNIKCRYTIYLKVGIGLDCT